MNRFFHVVYAIVRPIVRLLFPMRAVGLENLPEGSAILCPNHASGWDPIIVAIALPNDSRLSIMAKDQLFRFKPLGWLLRKLGAFPVRRGANDLAAIKTAMKALQEDQRLLMFPEGTRVEHQGDVEAKGGVTMLATRTGAPVVPIYCGGRHKFLRRTTVVFGQPYKPVIAGRRPTPEENHAIAEELLLKIYALSEVDGWK